jgi:hypothetical protein
VEQSLHGILAYQEAGVAAAPFNSHRPAVTFLKKPEIQNIASGVSLVKLNAKLRHGPPP